MYSYKISASTIMRSYRTFFLYLILSLSISIATEENQKKVAKNNENAMKKCYHAIGCLSLKWPWTGFWRRSAPRSPADLQIEFILITRRTPTRTSLRQYKVSVTDAYEPTENSLAELGYNAARPYTVFHFWGCAGTIEKTAKYCEGLIEPYLEKKILRKMMLLGARLEDIPAQFVRQNAYGVCGGIEFRDFQQVDVNLIFVLWDANILKYHRCVSDTRTVAAVTSMFIESLIRSQNLTKDKIHLIGESVGAHIIGYIGKRIPNIYRLTALDPAQPAFEGHHPIVRLDSADAQHVDVLHTNAVPFRLLGGFGFVNPIGDVDFYFNNGVRQPGCGLGIVARCSHIRVDYYWKEALKNDCIMWGVKKPEEIRPLKKFLRDATKLKTNYTAKCESEKTEDNCAPVGWNTFKKEVKGVYHVKTNSKKPFCISGE